MFYLKKKLDIDIDECAIGRHTCPTMATCVNTPKSYKCVCPSGYKLDVTRNICEDIDECALGKVCPSNSYCRNTPGSFTCECKTGFTLVSHIFYSCVGEFKLFNQHFIFSLKLLIVNNNKKSIKQIELCNYFQIFIFIFRFSLFSLLDDDECANPNICDHKCVNTFGSYQCVCNEGYRLDSDKRTCVGKDKINNINNSNIRSEK